MDSSDNNSSSVPAPNSSTPGKCTNNKMCYLQPIDNLLLAISILYIFYILILITQKFNESLLMYKSSFGNNIDIGYSAEINAFNTLTTNADKLKYYKLSRDEKIKYITQKH